MECDGDARTNIHNETKRNQKKEREQHIKMNNKGDKWLGWVIKETVMRLMNPDEDDNYSGFNKQWHKQSAVNI